MKRNAVTRAASGLSEGAKLVSVSGNSLVPLGMLSQNFKLS